MKPTRVLLLALGLSTLAPLATAQDEAGKARRREFRASAGRGMETFASDGIVLTSWLTLDDFDGPLGSAVATGADCWGYTSPSGREYALMTTNNGLVVVEVSDPSNATIVGAVAGNSSLWRDVKTYDKYCYVVTEASGDGIQVVDLGGVDSGVVTLVTTINDGGVTSSHNVVVDNDSGYLYRCGGASNTGLRMYDLTNPAAPAFVGEWNDQYVHDAEVITFTSGPASGRQLAFVCSGGGNGGIDTQLEVVDVTDKGAPFSVIRVDYDPSNSDYSHQVSYDPVRQLLYLNDELDEGPTVSFTTTHVFDAANPLTPVHLGSFNNGNPAIGHNLYVKGDFVYEANYSSGLRIFDISASTTNPPEVAWFDTFPANDVVDYVGLWSVYPYFDSGTVIGSDMNRGLFVWYVGDPLLTLSLPQTPPQLVGRRGRTLEVQIDELTPGELEPGTERIHVDRGNGFESLPLSPVDGGGNGLFLAELYAGPDCGTPIRYYFSAESKSAGITWTYPEGAPSAFLSATSADREQVAYDDPAEVDQGWTVGDLGDSATTGIWELDDPEGTGAQPEDDHTPTGTNCWFTGQGSASLGSNDVDGGSTTLFSPVLDASSMSDPVLTYWRWYSNDQGFTPDDEFVVEISNDAGSSWFPLETLTNSTTGWEKFSVNIADVLPPTSQMQLKFVATDALTGSIVEAAVDDLSISEFRCRGDQRKVRGLLAR